MSLLDWVFIGTLSSAILFALFSLLSVIFLFSTRNQVRQLARIRTKNARKRKKIKRVLKKTEAKRKKQGWNLVVFIMLACIMSGTAFYARYYQATNLGERDSEGIVQGYYLLNETKNQINILNESSNPEKAENNLRELAAKLSSFGMRGADGRLTAEGQRLLTRYYNQVKELGLNLNNQSVEMVENTQTRETYINDLQKAQKIQSKIITYFKINENALKQKK
ncbi:hypothetical protein UAW_02068 [Enterococcus haemoperoxidus ATCC BAA-382]|uniref:Uncharacterized protein n=1 Tax=Enterococcus haemoperoxidus ATCC BAA-382 TaxID=1158608 RepID=R2T450_9ENTE|nr:hypothetical protein [Enterococcus haemoperoxidus]EOH94989.1 hypothetical protein UAW_02068 [Enterococcus haemoperoxidus ATCC BAA-382]EOT60388.1 hypothetical protein I583_03034 [Enterococcus haemoperoxidus ATCC BAA-382]OJG54820.1 hypothetical protein RV06_GL002342 [Enterococcus haemoperoxidus]